MEKTQRIVGYSYNPRTEKVEAGGLGVRLAWLDDKIIKRSI